MEFAQLSITAHILEEALLEHNQVSLVALDAFAAILGVLWFVVLYTLECGLWYEMAGVLSGYGMKWQGSCHLFKLTRMLLVGHCGFSAD